MSPCGTQGRGLMPFCEGTPSKVSHWRTTDGIWVNQADRFDSKIMSALCCTFTLRQVLNEASAEMTPAALCLSSFFTRCQVHSNHNHSFITAHFCATALIPSFCAGRQIRPLAGQNPEGSICGILDYPDQGIRPKSPPC